MDKQRGETPIIKGMSDIWDDKLDFIDTKTPVFGQ